MNENQIKIRKAEYSDAEQIAFVHVNGWRETYSGMISERVLANMSIEKSTAIFRKNECRNIVVAIDDENNIVGFCGYGESRDGNSELGEIHGIYLLKKYQHKGVGRRMLAYAVDSFKEADLKGVYIWVLAENIKAIEFYEKNGFLFSGETKSERNGDCILSVKKYILRINENISKKY